MTAVGWTAAAALAAVFVFVVWCVRHDLREDSQLRAELNKTNAAVNELRAYITEVVTYLNGADEQQPATGRHARTSEQEAAA